MFPYHFHSILRRIERKFVKQKPQEEGEKSFESIDSGFFRLRHWRTDLPVKAAMKTTESIYTPRQKQFKLLHLQGTHLPWVMDEKGEPCRHSALDSDLRQARGSLEMVYSLLQKLTEQNSYDNSLIIIMADHGQQPTSRSAVLLDPSTLYRPLLLVKRPQDKHETMPVNDTPIHLCDTSGAILAELGLQRSNKDFSWFNVPKDLAEQRRKEWNDYWNRTGHSRIPRLSFSPGTNDADVYSADNEINVPLKHVYISRGEFSVQLLGKENDDIDRMKIKNCHIVLLLRTGQVPPLTTDSLLILRQKMETATNWGTQAVLDFTGVPDGEYEIIAVFEKDGKPYHCKLNKNVQMTGGQAARLNY
jgi:hypothetical protein